MSLTADAVSAIVLAVYAARKSRRAHPDGTFDKSGRWYPSEEEDANGSGSDVRSPSRAWPYSYMIRCRTRTHCKNLVLRGLSGESVPLDVEAAIEKAQAACVVEKKAA